MQFEYVPLLQVQRDLCDLPRGSDRFEQYIATLRGNTLDDMELPLSAFNPMGKDHVAAILDEYMSLNADEIARHCVVDAAARYGGGAQQFRVTLVLADDAKGGWTNRYATEFDHRFGGRANHRRGWVTGLLWTSEKPDVQLVQDAASEAVARAAYVARHGYAATLGQMLLQLRAALADSQVRYSLDEEELEYTAEVIRPELDSDVNAVQIACLFGDEAAKELGHQPFGLSARAGFALAMSSLPIEA